MKAYYTKEQRDLIWSQFAIMVAQQQQIVDMEQKWAEMKKHSALKDKIIAELKQERKVLEDGVHVRQVNNNL